MSNTRSGSQLPAVVGLIGLIAAVLAVATPLAAPEQKRPHRARLSQGLARQVASGSAQIPVLYEGPQAEVDRLAQAYGLKVERKLGMGALFSGSAAAVNALAQDDNVWSLAEDQRVISTMSVTTAATGAGQLWKAA